MRYLLYDRRGHVTGQELGERLGIEHGQDMPDERYDWLIRWGTSDRIQYIPNERTWNRRTAIAQNTNKFESLRVMQENGVPVPPFSRNPNDLEYPLIGRGNNHMGGRDVRLIMQGRDIQVNGPADYYLQYIPKKKEYRVHIIDDEVVKISEKRLNDADEYDQLVWNYDTGWTFHHPTDTHASVYMAMAAVNALDLDFGAVDMIIGEDENPYILEVNTCPGLDEPSLDIYEEKFRELIEL